MREGRGEGRGEDEGGEGGGERGGVRKESGVISMCITIKRSRLTHVSEFKPPSPTWEVSFNGGSILCGCGEGRGRGGEGDKVRWKEER